jgi:hypothetical protein
MYPYLMISLIREILVEFMTAFVNAMAHVSPTSEVVRAAAL